MEAEFPLRRAQMTKTQSNTTVESMVAVREAYEAPKLILLGDVRDLTLGGSAGSGDSGNPGAERF